METGPRIPEKQAGNHHGQGAFKGDVFHHLVFNGQLVLDPEGRGSQCAQNEGIEFPECAEENPDSARINLCVQELWIAAAIIRNHKKPDVHLSSRRFD